MGFRGGGGPGERGNAFVQFMEETASLHAVAKNQVDIWVRNFTFVEMDSSVCGKRTKHDAGKFGEF